MSILSTIISPAKFDIEQNWRAFYAWPICLLHAAIPYTAKLTRKEDRTASPHGSILSHISHTVVSAGTISSGALYFAEFWKELTACTSTAPTMGCCFLCFYFMWNSESIRFGAETLMGIIDLYIMNRLLLGLFTNYIWYIYIYVFLFAGFTEIAWSLGSPWTHIISCPCFFMFFPYPIQRQPITLE